MYKDWMYIKTGCMIKTVYIIGFYVCTILFEFDIK